MPNEGGTARQLPLDYSSAAVPRRSQICKLTRGSLNASGSHHVDPVRLLHRPRYPRGVHASDLRISSKKTPDCCMVLRVVKLILARQLTVLIIYTAKLNFYYILNQEQSSSLKGHGNSQTKYEWKSTVAGSSGRSVVGLPQNLPGHQEPMSYLNLWIRQTFTLNWFLKCHGVS